MMFPFGFWIAARPIDARLCVFQAAWAVRLYRRLRVFRIVLKVTQRHGSLAMITGIHILSMMSWRAH